MKKLLLILLAVCLIAGLAACNDTTEVYSLTFDTQEGGDDTVIRLDGSADLVFPSDPVKEGYDFKGWFFDKDVWENPVSVSLILQTGITANTTVYAKWEEEAVPPDPVDNPDVSFDVQGGAIIQKMTDVDVINPAPKTARTGYEFLGWLKNEDDQTFVSFPYTPEEDITLIAKWRIVNYSITYNTYGGTASNPASYTIENRGITLQAATRTGYTFNGWYADSTYQTQEVTSISAGTKGNLLLYASWSINNYKLIYYLNGVPYMQNETPVVLTFDYGAKLTNVINALDMNGYGFSGWKLNDGKQLPLTMPAQDLNVYGRLTPNVYTITYFVDHVAYRSQSVACGETIPYIQAPVRQGYSFSGWEKDMGGAAPSVMPDEDIEIYGYFTDILEIIYLIDGAEHKRVSYRFNEIVSKEPEPERTGYIFSGWTGEPDNMPDTNIYATGYMTPKTYKLYFSATENCAYLEGIPAVGGQEADYIEVAYDEDFLYRLSDVKGVLFAFHFAGWTCGGAAFAPERWTYDYNEVEDGKFTLHATYTEKSTQGLKYTLLSDNTYSVTGYSGVATEVYIPSSYNGLQVKQISDTAFKNNQSVTMITLHNGISRLGTNSFENCGSLVTVNLGQSVQNIEAETFLNCSSLAGFTVPAGIGVIGNAPFRGCASLGEILVNAGNTLYMAVDGALYNISGTSLIQFPQGKDAASFAVPSSVTTIGNYAFSNCVSLTSVTLGRSVRSIGCYAFAGTSVTSMVLSENVTWIGSNAFDGCSALQSLTIPFVGSSRSGIGTSEGLLGYVFGNAYFTGSVEAYQWYSAINYVKYYLPAALTSVTLTDTYQVPYGAFSGCTAIESVTLGNAGFINEKAFFGCSALTQVLLPRSLTGIDTDAFNGCVSLESLTLPVKLTFVGEYAFHNCPASATAVYESVAYTDDNFGYVLHENSDGISEAAYIIEYISSTTYDNTVVPELSSNIEIVSIGKAFQNVTGMYTVSLPSGITTLDPNAFDGCGYLAVYARNVSKPETWVDIWDDPAIYWNVGSVDIFYENDFNYYVTNNKAVITRYTGNEENLDIPTAMINGTPVVGIGKYAFAGNMYLETVKIPDTVTSIGRGAFAGCPQLTFIDVDELNSHYLDADGVLYNKTSTLLLQYPAGAATTDFTVPATVLTIASEAFTDSNLVRITFTNTLTTIEAGAFKNSVLLTHVIDLNITGVTHIADSVFSGCVSLTSLTLSAAISSIGNNAFKDCASLASVNGTAGARLTGFNRLTSIGNAAFQGCTALNALTLPASLIQIGYYAFSGCTQLTSVSVPDSVLAIGDAAFSGCSGLTFVKLSSGLARVSSDLLLGCTSIKSLTLPFVGATAYASGAEDAVLGYLFGYTHTQPVDNYIVQSYAPGLSAYYFIPEYLEEVIVTNADNLPYGAFSNINTLENVEIGSSLQSIEENAFVGCSTITNLIVPFIGASRTADGAEAILGYLFGEAASGGVTQVYGEGLQGNYAIPAVLVNLEITDATYIHRGALYNISSLTQVVLNANIISIGEEVLYGCNAIETLTIPFVGSNRDAEGTHDAVFGYLFGEGASGVTQYYTETSSAMYHIPAGIERVELTSADMLPYGAFAYTSLPTIIINDGIETIGEIAFAYNTALIELALTNSVLTVGRYAFAGCTGLTDVALNRVRYVEEYAFYQTAITHLTIPDTVIRIDEGAFSGITALQSVTVSLYNSSLNMLGDYAFRGDSALEIIALPNRLSSIGEGIFAGCSSLERVSVPFVGAQSNASGTREAMFGYIFGSVSYPGAQLVSQSYDTVAESFYLPATLHDVIITNATQIGGGAFSGLGDIDISLNEGITVIKSYAFFEAQPYDLEIPASVVTIEEKAFLSSDCGISFPLNSRLVSIGVDAFAESIGINSFYVPASVQTIAAGAFRNAVHLSTLSFIAGSVLISIGNGAFEGATALAYIALPASLLTVGDNAFAGCTSLAGITFGNGARLISLGAGVFRDTAVLTISLPATTVSVGEEAFADSLLQSISFGGDSSALETIDSFAFAGSALQSVEIPSGVRFIGLNPFLDTPVAALALSGYRTGYKVVNNVLYSIDGSLLIVCPQSLAATSYIVPEGVTRIESFAFAGNDHLASVSFPSSLLSIGENAFESCASLASVSFGTNAKLLVIEESAFASCSSLAAFPMPVSLIRIGDSAFSSTALVSVNLRDAAGLVYIGEEAFSDCVALSTFALPQGIREIGASAFAFDTSLAAINLGELNALTHVGEMTFSACESLTSVSIPSNVIEIGSMAFASCKTLASVSFAPSGALEQIGFMAFSDTALVSIVLPVTLSKIGHNAFVLCPSLKSVTLPFVGASIGAAGEEAELAYVFGNTESVIETLVLRNGSEEIALSASAFENLVALKHVTLGEGVVLVGEGILQGLPIVSLNLGFAGASASASGREALLGYLFGFDDAPGAGRVAQMYSDTQTAYAAIPSTLTTIILDSAPDYGALSGIASLTSLTVRDGAALGKNLVAGCTSLASLTIPYAGASAGASGAEGSISYLTGGTLAALITLSLTAVESLQADAIDISTLRTLSIAGTLTELPEGVLSNCTSLINLTLPFVGKSENATGSDGLTGYLFGFEAAPTAQTVEQAVFISGLPTYYYSEIPASLTHITLTRPVKLANGSFSNMTFLLSVTAYGNAAASGNIVIENHAFFGCDRLQALVLGGSAKLLSVGEYAFAGSRIESAVISAGVTSIGAHAFENCESLISVTFEAGSQLTSVGAYAFHGCTALQNIVFPSGVLSVGNNVFTDCATLSSAVIPSTVTTIGASVFTGCINLASLSVPFLGPDKDGAASAATDNISYLFDTVPPSLKTLAITAATYLAEQSLANAAITSLTLNEGILQIGTNALLNVPVNALILPASVLTIGEYAFANSGIRTFSAATGSVLGTIGSNAFKGCSLLSDVVIPDNVTYMGASVFFGTLLNVRFSVPFVGASRTATGASAVLGYFFGNAVSGVTQKYSSSQTAIFAIPATLKNVYVTSATMIGYGAFSNCVEITTISVNASVSSIGQFALEGTTKLGTLTLPFVGNTKVSSGSMATMRFLFGEATASGISNVTTLRLTAAEIIAASAFAGMTGLINVTLNDGINSIAQGAFAGCTAIQTMTVPYIGSRMMPLESNPEQYLLGYWFETRTAPGTGVTAQVYMNTTEQIYYSVLPLALSSVTVTSAYKLGYGALSSLASLTSVTINSNLTEFGQNVFKGSNAIETLTLPFIGRTKNSSLDSEIRLTYLFGSSPSGLRVINVTAATKIGANAFSNNTKITTIVLNEGITSIGNNAFIGMTSLTSVNMPSTLRSIGAYAFSGCTVLSSVVFHGAQLTTISERAFENTAINSLIIPDSVTTLGEGVLKGCMNLETLTTPFVGMSRTATGQSALLGHLFGILSGSGSQTITQIYTESNNAIYTVLPNNLYALHITAATSLAYGALYNCADLTTVTLNSGLLTIGRLAFANCSNLEALIVPDSVTNIAFAAFSGCSSLKSVSLPFAGTSRSETGATALFGYVFGAVDIGVSGATVQYFDVLSSRTYYIPDLLENVAITSASSLSYGVFYNMSRVKSISINEGLGTIPQKAFYNCASVESLTIPYTVTSIAAGALEGMNALVSLSLPFTGTSLSATGASGQLGAIFGTVADYDANVYVQTGANALRTFYKIPFSLRYVTLTVSTAVKEYAFAGCAGIATVSFAQPQTSVGDYAFTGCSGLAAFYGDLSALTSIGDGAFENCRSFLGIDLTQAQLLEHIGNRAFAGCSNLAFLMLPDNLTNLPPDALEGSGLE